MTRTHLPLVFGGIPTYSPVIDAGNDSFAKIPFSAGPLDLTTDQRGAGFPRKIDIVGVGGESPSSTVDMGAAELLVGEAVDLPPQIMDVIISSSLNGESRSYYELVNNNTTTFAGDQVRRLPFQSADTIEIQFSEAMNISGNELTAMSIKDGNDYSLYVASGGTTEYSWSLNHPSKQSLDYFDSFDQVLLILKDTIVAASDGEALDGDWVNPVSLTTTTATSSISQFPSGDPNRVPGGEFRFVFTTDTIGDYDGSGAVGQGDTDLVLLSWGDLETALPPGWVGLLPADTNLIISQDELDRITLNWGAIVLDELFLLGDFNDDGAVTQADLDYVLGANWGESETGPGLAGIFDDELINDLDDVVGQSELDAVLANWGVWFRTNLIVNPPLADPI